LLAWLHFPLAGNAFFDYPTCKRLLVNCGENKARNKIETKWQNIFVSVFVTKLGSLALF
jgi:hypothetical protein